MLKDNICVSAFGFKDVVCINGQTYTVPELVPTVVIKDPDQKFNMYSHDAIFERSGMGLNKLNDHNVRIPVCILWQQIKQFDATAQYEAATRLSKYVLSLIIHAYAELKITSDNGVLFDKDYLRSNAQITLCIPDFFDESEQQCLLDAFEGFNFRLLWRSVAAIIGSFNEDAPQLAEAGQNQHIMVLYLGPDSFDLTSYNYQVEADGYVTPIRRKPVYTNCSLDTSYPVLALSNATHILNNTFASQANLSLEQRLSILSQLFFNSPFVWLEQPLDDGMGNCNALCLKTEHGNQWHIFDGNQLSFLELVNQKALIDLSETFVKNYDIPLGLIPTQTEDSFNGIFQSQLIKLIDTLDFKPSANDYLIFTGPFALGVMAKQFLSLLTPQASSCSNMAIGGYVFNLRLDQGLPTYLDSVRKLSMVSLNPETNQYFEQVLIEAKTTVPYEDLIGTPIQQKINKYADGIELYISSDENFTDETILLAASTGFAAQGIDVYKATLPFKSGKKAPREETVEVTVIQKVLSGYVRVDIKPVGKSDVLPMFGVSAAFDPKTKVLYQEGLSMMSYPEVAEPLALATELKYLTRDNLFFSSTSKASKLIYYNGHFSDPEIMFKVSKFTGGADGKPNIKQIVYAAINHQLDKVADTLKKAQLPEHVNDLLKYIAKEKQFLLLTYPDVMSNRKYKDMVSYFDEAFEIVLPDAETRNRNYNLPKMLRWYSRMIPDTPEYCKKCADMYTRLDIEEVDYQVLFDIRAFIENHPRSFTVTGQDFAMTQELSQLMIDGCSNNLQRIAKGSKFLDSAKIFQNCLTSKNSSKSKTAKASSKKKKGKSKTGTISGSRMLSYSLAALLYALIWRRVDNSFLSDTNEIQKISSQLDAVKIKIAKIQDFVKTIEIPESFASLKERVTTFTTNTPVTIDEVIKFLYSKGTNTNIMAKVNEVDQDDDDENLEENSAED